MIINNSAYVEVTCTNCKRPERITAQHAERLKAAGIAWTCRTGTGCGLERQNQTTKPQEQNK
jgi:hypothetical protein